MTALSEFRDHDDDHISGGTSEHEQRHARIAKLNLGLQLPRGINTGSQSVANSVALQQAIGNNAIGNNAVGNNAVGNNAVGNSQSSEPLPNDDSIVEAELVDEGTDATTASSREVSYDQFRRDNETAWKDLGRLNNVVQMLTESFSKNPESGIDQE